MSELVKIKIKLEYEIVGRNIYGSPIGQKLAEEIFRANRWEIMGEACSDFKFEISEIKNRQDLPSGYNEGCLPWISVMYGDKISEKTIGEILKE